MGNSTDGLIVPQTRHEGAIHNFEMLPSASICSVGGLVEKATHLSVTFPISAGVDAAADDPETGLTFASTRRG